MSIWLDKKYASLLSVNLEKFSILTNTPFLAKFRCPYCGDSRKNKSKTRGFLYQKDSTKVAFRCHNCGKNESFSYFLKYVNPSAYSDYRLDTYKENNPEELDYTPVVEEKKADLESIEDSPFFTMLKKVSQLPEDHPAKKYVVSRQIPSEHHYRMYYCPKYCAWGNMLVSNKFSEKSLLLDEPRIVFPFVGMDGKVFGCQGRSLKPDGIRYISLVWDKSRSKIFGLDRISLKKRIYCVEGPIDSFFIDNCCAMAGSDIDLESIFGSTDNIVKIYDNEPRNKDIVSRLRKDIEAGLKVVVWDPSFEEKDINDAILAGYSRTYIQKLIDTSTFSGLEAKLKFNEWNRV